MDLNVFNEQQRWITPRNYGGYIANFECVLTEQLLSAEIRADIHIKYGKAIANLGNCRLEVRTNWTWQLLPMDDFLPAVTSEDNPEKGYLSVTNTLTGGKFATLIKGTNLLCLLVSRIPETEIVGGEISTTLSIMVSFEDHVEQRNSTTVMAVRGIQPVTRMVRWASSSATLLCAGGLPNQEYELQASPDLLKWGRVLQFSSWSGDATIEVPDPYHFAFMFFRVLPVHSPPFSTIIGRQ
ncbi:MAG: hypothetical protein Q7R93_02960 [bacterium]|nr:hypothetical protein [bacterium]